MFCIRRQKTFPLSFILRRYRGTISVSPSTSLVTDLICIRGSGYDSLVPITITSRARCEPERLSFTSYAHIVTTNHGDFDLSTSESISGTYTGVDEMGLFWSMVADPSYINRFQMNDSSVPVEYEFSVLDGHIGDRTGKCEDKIICKASIERLFLSQSVRRTVIKNPPLHGTLFVPPGEGPFPAVITIYGGQKRKQLVEDAAALLANNGFVTLVMAFFGYEGLPKVYMEEPLRLELFEEAIEYLKSLDVVDSNAIGVYGISKGGEIAFTMASFLPDVKAAVNVNGGMYVCGTSTTYRNLSIPDGSIDVSKGRELPDGMVVGLDTVFDCDDVPHSLIPIENTERELLYVAGCDDHCFPSEKHADFAAEKMRKAGKTNLEVAKFPGMGHLVDLPFVPPCTVSFHLFHPNKLFYYGGGRDKRLHCEQVGKTWETVVEFFKRVLCG